MSIQPRAALPESRAKRVALPLLLLFIGGTIVWTLFFSPLSSSPAPTAPALSTRIGEVRQVALADGSQLILDTDTRILTAFTREQRWIELQQGRARIVVAKDKIRPFLIRVGDREIITAGTMFDVRNSHGIDLHMLHGNAEIRGAEIQGAEIRGTKPEALTVGTGERIIIPQGPDAVPVRSKIPASYGQWVDEIQGFEDAPVRDIIAQANDYGREKIELTDPAMGDRTISGQINVRNPAATARAIAERLGLAVDRSHAGRILIGPPDRQGAARR